MLFLGGDIETYLTKPRTEGKTDGRSCEDNCASFDVSEWEPKMECDSKSPHPRPLDGG